MLHRSTNSLDAPLSLLIASVIVAIIKIPKKKTSSPNVKEKRKAGTCAGLTKAAIAAAAATLQRRERTRALGFAPVANEMWLQPRRRCRRGAPNAPP